MSELPAGIPRAAPAEPRWSASGIVLRNTTDGWQVLLGLRSRASRFMPGHLAFPGGTVDPGDEPEREGVFARTLAREMQEETGLDRAATAWIPSGERTTPPIFPVRFRTAFFVIEAGTWSPPKTMPSPDELDSLEFRDPQEVLDEWASGAVRLPPPVVPILRTLAELPRVDLYGVCAAVAATNAQEESEPRIEFVPRLWMVPVGTATLPPASHTNCWLPGQSRYALVDPGAWDDDDRLKLMRVVRRRARLDQMPAAVLVTHEHQDHVHGAAQVARELGVPVHAHPETLRVMQERGWDEGDVPAVVEVRDGDRLQLGECVLEAVHTPGHSAGHIGWWMPEQRWMIAGDLISGISTILVNPEPGCMADYLNSLRRVQALGPKMLFPGHGPPVPGAALQRLIDHRAVREATIASQLKIGPTRLSAIARASYPEIPEAPSFLIEGQTLAHLIHLEEQGGARRLDDGGKSWSIPDPASDAVAAEIEVRLRRAFRPTRFRIGDESWKHKGHPGASSGGGHYDVEIVSAQFEGLSRVEQHRSVYAALEGLIGDRIHALKLKTASTDEQR